MSNTTTEKTVEKAVRGTVTIGATTSKLVWLIQRESHIDHGDAIREATHRLSATKRIHTIRKLSKALGQDI